MVWDESASYHEFVVLHEILSEVLWIYMEFTKKKKRKKNWLSNRPFLGSVIDHSFVKKKKKYIISLLIKILGWHTVIGQQLNLMGAYYVENGEESLFSSL